MTFLNNLIEDIFFKKIINYFHVLKRQLYEIIQPVEYCISWVEQNRDNCFCDLNDSFDDLSIKFFRFTHFLKASEGKMLSFIWKSLAI